MIALCEVIPERDRGLLFNLLAERTPDQSISHRYMPTWQEHCAFVANHPYKVWYVIADDDVGAYVGSIYLSPRREVGVAVLNEYRRRGYAQAAIAHLRELHPGPLLANVNPANAPSHKLWESLGGKIIQVTYEV